MDDGDDGPIGIVQLDDLGGKARGGALALDEELTAELRTTNAIIGMPTATSSGRSLCKTRCTAVR